MSDDGTSDWPKLTTEQALWLMERGLIADGPTEFAPGGRYEYNVPLSKWTGEVLPCWKEQAEAIRLALDSEEAPR